MDTKPYVSQYGLLGFAVLKCWGFGIGSGSLSGNWGIGVEVLGIGVFRCYIKGNKKKTFSYVFLNTNKDQIIYFIEGISPPSLNGAIPSKQYSIKVQLLYKETFSLSLDGDLNQWSK